MDATLDEDVLVGWVGNSARLDDNFDAGTARRMAETLDLDTLPDTTDSLPALWHWLYFIDSAPESGLGADGHPARGGFLPPVALPRRMWAGGQLAFDGPLMVGEAGSKESTVVDVTLKTGSTGRLCFVKVRHEIEGAGGGRIVEHQDIVYRDDPKPGGPRPPSKPPPSGAEWTRKINPDPVLLFRYSALTFNGHRIHYDRPYATETEGYGGLVIHGPLTATLLAGLATEHGSGVLSSFSFRGVAPLLDSAPFRICGKPTDDGIDLWAETPEGALAMSAQARFG